MAASKRLAGGEGGGPKSSDRAQDDKRMVKMVRSKAHDQAPHRSDDLWCIISSDVKVLTLGAQLKEVRADFPASQPCLSGPSG
ncbi:MAG: hypothetical protein JRN37_09695 [Nitrososphaerota archaeon]|nr:hypothetical protein [Nitrososphaerota archaeon]MDG7043270.1 hypothetical protein [Nitrososphaerota archaeon]